MNHRLIAALTIAFLMGGARAEAKYRTWTDAQDRTVTAEFVRINNGNVVLKVNNGKVMSVPFFSLSDGDQEFVSELLEAKGQGGQLPKKPKGGFNFSSPTGTSRPQAGAGFNAPGANGAGAGPGGMMPPGGFAPGRMPPTGVNMPANTPPGSGNPGNGYMPPGGNQAANPATTPPGGYGVPGNYPPGGYPGAGAAPGAAQTAAPGLNPNNYNPSATNAPGSNLSNPGPAGPGMSPLAGAFPQTGMPQSNPGIPSQPLGVSPVTPGMGGGIPQMQWVETKTCEQCKKEVPSTSKAGDRCPHCGVYWGYEQGQNGTKTYAIGYRAGKVVGGILFLLALVGTGLKKLMGR